MDYFSKNRNHIETIDIRLLHQLFPVELTNHFNISHYDILCSLETKQEYWVIEFEEKNEVPGDHAAGDYESKGFMES